MQAVCCCVGYWDPHKVRAPGKHLFLRGGRNIVCSIFVHKDTQYIHFGLMEWPSPFIIQDTTPKSVDAALTLIFQRWSRYHLSHFCPSKHPILQLWVNSTTQPLDNQSCNYTNGWRSIDYDFEDTVVMTPQAVLLQMAVNTFILG